MQTKKYEGNEVTHRFERKNMYAIFQWAFSQPLKNLNILWPSNTFKFPRFVQFSVLCIFKVTKTETKTEEIVTVEHIEEEEFKYGMYTILLI